MNNASKKENHRRQTIIPAEKTEYLELRAITGDPVQQSDLGDSEQ